MLLIGNETFENRNNEKKSGLAAQNFLPIFTIAYSEDLGGYQKYLLHK